MFEDLKTTKENIANLNIKLYEEKGFVSLGWLHAAITGPLYYYPDVSDTEYLKKINSLEARENTLAYLKRLLEQGELKAGRFKNFDELPGIRENPEKYAGQSRVVDRTGTPEEIITNIRKEWENCPEDKINTFESFDVVFTLPENEWPKF